MSSYSPSYSQFTAMPSHDLRRYDKKKPSNYAGFKVFLIRYERPRADELAERTGLEPATSGVTGQHSNQLNYRSMVSSIFKPQLCNIPASFKRCTIQVTTWRPHGDSNPGRHRERVVS